MNCANHPETPVAAYCQDCGKPLCDQCMRQVGNIVLCERCLAIRLGIPPAGAPASAGATPGIAPGVPVSSTPNPAAAAVLGFIPGVGAMYNGQFIKALIHVVVFVVLIGIAGRNGIFGVFVGAWVLYQVFDAYHTARARLHGVPVPDPFGLNEFSNRMGAGAAAAPPPPPPAAWSAVPPADPGAYTQVPNDPVANAPGASYPPYATPARRWDEPIGAIVLIVIGTLFLFSSLGVFDFDWISRGWPVLIIVLGAWLLFKRTRGSRTGGVQ